MTTPVESVTQETCPVSTEEHQFKDDVCTLCGYEMPGTPLYVFIGIYDGVVDEVSLHVDEKDAEQAYTAYTMVPYNRNETISEHVDASTIQKVNLTLEKSAQLFSNLLNQPKNAQVIEFMGKLQAANRARMER